MRNRRIAKWIYEVERSADLYQPASTDILLFPMYTSTHSSSQLVLAVSINVSNSILLQVKASMEPSIQPLQRLQPPLCCLCR